MRLVASILALVATVCTAQSVPEAVPIPAASQQMVLVITPDWRATHGTLRTFERTSDGPWQEVDEATPVVVGRSGLGWGRGLHPAQEGPQKREGDGRAPAGVFDLTAAFGYAEAETTGLSYVRAMPSVKCVDDAESAFYNLVVDQAEVTKDWKSRERMRRADSLYSVGVVVAHNGPGVSSRLVPEAGGPKPVAGAGSCIFLHVWRGPGSSTAGCTAMPSAALRSVMNWLDTDRQPVLVQLPNVEAERVRDAWGLPE
ncbi:MAG: L,D-transpeptidase family protein [Bacteroidota bacterium]